MRRLGVFRYVGGGPMIFGGFGLITLYVVRVVGPGLRISPQPNKATGPVSGPLSPTIAYPVWIAYS